MGYWESVKLLGQRGGEGTSLERFFHSYGPLFQDTHQAHSRKIRKNSLLSYPTPLRKSAQNCPLSLHWRKWRLNLQGRALVTFCCSGRGNRATTDTQHRLVPLNVFWLDCRIREDPGTWILGVQPSQDSLLFLQLQHFFLDPPPPPAAVSSGCGVVVVHPSSADELFSYLGMLMNPPTRLCPHPIVMLACPLLKIREIGGELRKENALKGETQAEGTPPTGEIRRRYPWRNGSV